jgi:hypothetical protein
VNLLITLALQKTEATFHVPARLIVVQNRITRYLQPIQVQVPEIPETVIVQGQVLQAVQPQQEATLQVGVRRLREVILQGVHHQAVQHLREVIRQGVHRQAAQHRQEVTRLKVHLLRGAAREVHILRVVVAVVLEVLTHQVAEAVPVEVEAVPVAHRQVAEGKIL